ncbi:FAD-dependent oxidoreductase [Amycolatopsis japonica]|uniref:FAD-dependent oxidoreductase n=1 Tax=Amycolatopsis japonica TaxID=208439 RepID=UPI00366EE592
MTPDGSKNEEVTAVSGQAGKRAIVLGGSVAGLFVARVLSESYSQVLVVDRDILTGVRETRRSVPQGKQVHGLLAKGQQVIEDLFPGFTEEIKADGAGIGDVAGNLRWYFNGKPLARDESGLVAVTASRPFLEYHIRRRVQALTNVTFLEGHDILSLATAEDGRRVVGAVVNGPDGKEETLTGDLVVDAMGRGSRTPVWLTELGYPRVEEEKLKIGIGYATRHYRLKTDPYRGDISINVIASPALPRGAICGKHGDKIELTAYGILDDHPPTDNEGFLAFIKSLPVPDIYDAISESEPLDDPVGYRFPTNLRRRYEKLADFPEGLFVAGDSVCSFNPTYAQGMTISALGALAMRKHLRSGAGPRPKQYLKELARDVLDAPWEMMNTGDLSFPDVPGKRTMKVKMGHAYVTKVLEAATRDGKVASAYLKMTGLVTTPEALMSPAMLLRVLRNSRGQAAEAA